MELPFTYGNEEDSTQKLFPFLDNWHKSCGYVFAQRSSQNAQTSYVNSALLTEIIKDNSLSVVFQNEERLRSGKLSQTRQGDQAV